MSVGITWTVETAEALEWPFNCGPAAICAALDITPQMLRPHLGDFERKGYTNPTLMRETLKRLGVRFSWLVVSGERFDRWPARLGLVRVQWDGPWCKPGVPMAARYRHTHWVASIVEDGVHRIMDINATCVGGWLPYAEWANQLVPWLLKEVEPKASGRWWVTHVVEVMR